MVQLAHTEQKKGFEGVDIRPMPFRAGSSVDGHIISEKRWWL